MQDSTGKALAKVVLYSKPVFMYPLIGQNAEKIVDLRHIHDATPGRKMDL